jgi:potassium channel
MGRMPDAAEIKLKEEQAELELQDAKNIIFPENKIKQRWDIFIAFLLIATAIYVPLRVSFFDQTTVVSLCFDFAFDFCFALDIVLTFFTAIQKRGGFYEHRHRFIAKAYMRSWFWVDLVCIVPV